MSRPCALGSLDQWATTVTTVDGEVHWDSTVIDDDIARAILEEMYTLPDRLDLTDAEERGADAALRGPRSRRPQRRRTYRRATAADLGL